MGPNYKAIWLHSHDHYYAFPSLWPVSMNQTSSGPSLEMTSGDEFFLLILESCPAGGPESASWRPSHSCSRVKNLLQQQLWPKIWSSCNQKCGAAGAEKRCLALSAELSLHSPPFQIQHSKIHVNEVKVKGWFLVWCQFFFEPEHLPVEGWLVCKMGIEDSIHCIND